MSSLIPMRKVQTRHIHTRVDHLDELVRVPSRWPHSADGLALAIEEKFRVLKLVKPTRFPREVLGRLAIGMKKRALWIGRCVAWLTEDLDNVRHALLERTLSLRRGRAA